MPPTAHASGQSLKEPALLFHHVVPWIELRLAASTFTHRGIHHPFNSSGKFVIATFLLEEGDLSPAVVLFLCLHDPQTDGWPQSCCRC